ncbi:hypothetical protein GQX74_001342 [Glossina fuscipes]|nr:hypothetical protein GQX74_001342 [Glossina fuscipes]
MANSANICKIYEDCDMQSEGNVTRLVGYRRSMRGLYRPSTTSHNNFERHLDAIDCRWQLIRKLNENRECKDAVRTANEWLSQQVHTEVGKSINDNLIRIFHIKNISAMRLMVALATVTVIVVETIVEQKIN